MKIYHKLHKPGQCIHTVKLGVFESTNDGTIGFHANKYVSWLRARDIKKFSWNWMTSDNPGDIYSKMYITNDIPRLPLVFKFENAEEAMMFGMAFFKDLHEKETVNEPSR